jgi:hypothetical protein
MTTLARRTLLRGSAIFLASTTLTPWIRLSHAAIPIGAIISVVTGVLSAVDEAKFKNNLNATLEDIRDRLVEINGKLDELIDLVQRLPLELERQFDAFERKQLQKSSEGALGYLARLQEATKEFPIRDRFLREQYEDLGIERSKHIEYTYTWKSLLYPAAANDICVIITSLYCANFLNDRTKKELFRSIVEGSLSYFRRSRTQFEEIRAKERQAGDSLKNAVNGFPKRGYLGFEYRAGRRGSREDPDGGTPPSCKHHYYNMESQNFSTRFSCCQRPGNFMERPSEGTGCRDENPLGIAAPPGWPASGVDFNGAWGKLDAIMKTLNAQIDTANAHYARADEADEHAKALAQIIAEIEKWERKNFA